MGNPRMTEDEKNRVWDFAEVIGHGNNQHRAWILDAAKAFNTGEPLPKPPIGPKLTFGDLKEGDRFIFFPQDGDNAGHGGYLGAHRIFTKVEAIPNSFWATGFCDNAAREGDGVRSTMPDSMFVIKLCKPV